jgi:hypothetical protein
MNGELTCGFDVLDDDLEPVEVTGR